MVLAAALAVRSVAPTWGELADFELAIGARRGQAITKRQPGRESKRGARILSLVRDTVPVLTAAGERDLIVQIANAMGPLVLAGSGTQDLTIDSASSGALARVELLETVRLDNDEVTVKWAGWSFETSLGARVVQQ